MIKCGICGKFISYMDLQENNAKTHYDPTLTPYPSCLFLPLHDDEVEICYECSKCSKKEEERIKLEQEKEKAE